MNHDHPFLNGLFASGCLLASKFLDYVHIKTAAIPALMPGMDWGLVFSRGVQLTQITLGIIAVVNFYWAAEKRYRIWKTRRKRRRFRR